MGKRSNNGIETVNPDTFRSAYVLTATCPAGAEYLGETYNERAKNSRMDPEAIAARAEANDNHIERVHLQHDRDNAWSPRTEVHTDFQNIHRKLAQAAVSTFPLEANSLAVDYTMNEATEFYRSFKLNDVTQESEPLAFLLNAFMAKEGFVTENKQVFLADSKGEIKKDSSGNPIKADPETVKNRIDTKFGDFVADTLKTSGTPNKTCNVTTKSHPCPPNLRVTDAMKASGVASKGDAVEKPVAKKQDAPQNTQGPSAGTSMGSNS